MNCPTCNQIVSEPVPEQESAASSFTAVYRANLSDRSELVERVMDAMVNRPTR